MYFRMVRILINVCYNIAFEPSCQLMHKRCRFAQDALLETAILWQERIRTILATHIAAIYPTVRHDSNFICYVDIRDLSIDD